MKFHWHLLSHFFVPYIRDKPNVPNLPETRLTGGLRGTAQFTLEALTRMKSEMDKNNALFNFRGEPYRLGDTILTMGMIDDMIDQIRLAREGKT